MTTWNTVWEIAGMRNNTKRGHGHLSPHLFEILQHYVQMEAREAMAKTVSVQFIDLSELF